MVLKRLDKWFLKFGREAVAVTALAVGAVLMLFLAPAFVLLTILEPLLRSFKVIEVMLFDSRMEEQLEIIIDLMLEKVRKARSNKYIITDTLV